MAVAVDVEERVEVTRRQARLRRQEAALARARAQPLEQVEQAGSLVAAQRAQQHEAVWGTQLDHLAASMPPVAPPCHPSFVGRNTAPENAHEAPGLRTRRLVWHSKGIRYAVGSCYLRMYSAPRSTV